MHHVFSHVRCHDESAHRSDSLPSCRCVGRLSIKSAPPAVLHHSHPHHATCSSPLSQGLSMYCYLFFPRLGLLSPPFECSCIYIFILRPPHPVYLPSCKPSYILYIELLDLQQIMKIACQLTVSHNLGLSNFVSSYQNQAPIPSGRPLQTADSFIHRLKRTTLTSTTVG